MKIVAIAGVVCAVALAAPLPTWAHGALAVGIAPNGAQEGVSFGISTKELTDDRARDLALSRCKGTATGTQVGVFNPKAGANCVLVTSFDRQCAVVAYDPADGTPGVGWAVAPTLGAAEGQALNNCKATAGEARKAYCVRAMSECDWP